MKKGVLHSAVYKQINISCNITKTNRFLTLILHLIKPNVRVAFCMSLQPNPGLIDYYLSLLPYPIEETRKRLMIVGCGDYSAGTLTQKVCCFRCDVSISLHLCVFVDAQSSIVSCVLCPTTRHAL